MSTPHRSNGKRDFFTLADSGGEGGIRTRDTLPYTHFPGVLLQPLGHLTVYFLILTHLHPGYCIHY